MATPWGTAGLPAMPVTPIVDTVCLAEGMLGTRRHDSASHDFVPL